jgi:hypothetical protein
MCKAMKILHNKCRASYDATGSSNGMVSTDASSSPTSKILDGLNFGNLHLMESRRSGKKNRAKGRHPPPAPNMQPLFPIHTPPSSLFKNSENSLRCLVPFQERGSINFKTESLVEHSRTPQPLAPNPQAVPQHFTPRHFHIATNPPVTPHYSTSINSLPWTVDGFDEASP